MCFCQGGWKESTSLCLRLLYTEAALTFEYINSDLMPQVFAFTPQWLGQIHPPQNSSSFLCLLLRRPQCEYRKWYIYFCIHSASQPVHASLRATPHNLLLRKKVKSDKIILTYICVVYEAQGWIPHCLIHNSIFSWKSIAFCGRWKQVLLIINGQRTQIWIHRWNIMWIF